MTGSMVDCSVWTGIAFGGALPTISPEVDSDLVLSPPETGPVERMVRNGLRGCMKLE